MSFTLKMYLKHKPTWDKFSISATPPPPFCQECPSSSSGSLQRNEKYSYFLILQDCSSKQKQKQSSNLSSSIYPHLYLKIQYWIIDYKDHRRYTSVSFEENTEIDFGIDPAKLYKEMSNSCFAKGRSGEFFLKLC